MDWIETQCYLTRDERNEVHGMAWVGVLGGQYPANEARFDELESEAEQRRATLLGVPERQQP